MVHSAGEREAISKLLFNAQHRLGVAAVFRSSGGESLRCDDVADRAGISRSVAHKELRVLVAVGALQRVDVDRSVFFQPLRSAFWTFCDELEGSLAPAQGRTS